MIEKLFGKNVADKVAATILVISLVAGIVMLAYCAKDPCACNPTMCY